MLTPEATTGKKQQDWLGRHVAVGGAGLTEALSGRGEGVWGALWYLCGRWTDWAKEEDGQPVGRLPVKQMSEAGATAVVAEVLRHSDLGYL